MNDTANIKPLRVLVAAGSRGTVSLLRQIFSVLGVRDINIATNPGKASEFLRREHFDVAFFDSEINVEGERPLILTARERDDAANPLIPIFLMANHPSRGSVERARDEGFTDVIARPVSIDTVKRKLQAVLTNPRPFIVGGDFFGPDRRSPRRPAFNGQDKRSRKARKVALPRHVRAEADSETEHDAVGGTARDHVPE